MIVIDENDGKMLNVVDIINKALPSKMKRINHFMEYEGIVYISLRFWDCSNIILKHYNLVILIL